MSAGLNTSTRARALETTTRWNVIERQVTNLLSNSAKLPEAPLVANDPKVLGVLVDIGGSSRRTIPAISISTRPRRCFNWVMRTVVC